MHGLYPWLSLGNMKRLVRVALFLGSLYPSLASGAPDPLAAIRESLAAGHYAEALAQLRGFLSNHPDHLDAHLLKGVVLTRQGKAQDAIDTFRMLAEKYPDLPESHNNLAVLYAAQGQYEAARQSLARAIELQPLYETAHENLGDVYIRLATAAYEEAYRLNPGNTRAREKQGQLAELLQDPAQHAEPPEPETPPAPGRHPGGVSCYATGDFSSRAESGQVIAWANARQVAATSRVTSEKKIKNYKVYLSPLPTMMAARKQVERMQQAGIKDVIVIARGNLTNGIALGIFSTLQATKKRIQDLRAKGYDAQYEPRYVANDAYYVELHAGDGKTLDEEAFRAAFPDRWLKPAPCN